MQEQKQGILGKIFGGLNMSWRNLIIFAVISGVVTGLIALLVPDGSSFRQIAVTFEAWIVLAIVVVVNCGTPLDAACKTFVYFLISQPLVYLVQVPFNSMGFRLFGYYYPYWFYWTLATFPGAFIAWYIKKDNILAALILSVALVGLIWMGAGYLQSTVGFFPKFLVSTLFCFGSVPLLIMAILKSKTPRMIAAVIAVIAAAVLIFLTFRNGIGNKGINVSIGLNSEKYPVTEGWTAELEDPTNGKAELTVGSDVVSSNLYLEFTDIEKNTTAILRDPDGTTYKIPVKIVRDGEGYIIDYGED